MAGSLAHLIDEDGSFRMDLIENLGDAQEALEDCFLVILAMSGGDMSKVSRACKKAKLVDPWFTKNRTSDDPVPDAMKWPGFLAGPEMEEAKKEFRIHNLEVAIQGMWTLLKDLHPDSYTQDVNRVMEDLYESSRSLGGYQKAYMKRRTDLETL